MYATRLLSRFGSGQFEPRMERIADYGVCGIVSPNQIELFTPHQQICDNQGVVRSIVIDDDNMDARLTPHRDQIERCADAAARALQQEGYQGVFGIDAFLYREHGCLRLQPMSEINARLTFGFVARTHAQSLGRSRFTLELPNLPGQKGTADVGRDGADTSTP